MRKTIEQLNLMDDFLFQETLSDPEYGEEAARLILETIIKCSIGKIHVKTQKVGTTGEPNMHAIRMDVYVEEESEANGTVYDLEVQQENTGELPKRSRYYQAIMDSKMLRSGMPYKEMRKLWVIIITSVDIFGENRMVYTFENRCVENLSLSLDDGAKRIFLYSKGEIGREEDLYRLLQYFESSVEENAVNPVTKSLHQMVEKVKNSTEIGVKYLKAIEWEYYITEKATREGLEKGMKEGLERGMQQGMQQGVHALIKTCKEFGLSKEEIARRIQDEFSLSEEETAGYMEKYYD